MNQNYQPLHQKYRPERFDELVGQAAISTTLKQALLSNRIAPAYLFTGPRGTGKTSSARILARSLNCLSQDSPTPNPCGDCAICKNIANGSSLDVIEIDAASNTGVDNIRELIERSKFSPVQARWKVYVIDECHMLSTAAFNALLKTLEEPPSHVVFILATTDPQRVIPTIISRCQRFDFRRIDINSLESHLAMIANKEKIEIDKEALTIIAKQAEGGLRDAESMLDQLSLLPQPIKSTHVWDLLGVIPEEELLAITQALTDTNPIGILDSCKDLLERGREPNTILQGLVSILRDLVVIKAAPERAELADSSKNIREKLIEISQQIPIEQLFSWQHKLKGSEYQLRQSSQPRLWLEVLLLGILSEENKNSVESTNQLRNKLFNDNNLSERDEVKRSIKTNQTFKPSDNNVDQEEKPSKETSAQKLDQEIDLKELWKQILLKLELPSTRMLLSQQAEIIRLTSAKAFVQVSSNWLGMVQSRAGLLETAINKTLESPRELVLESSSERIDVKENVSNPLQTDINTVKDTNAFQDQNIQKPPRIDNKSIVPDGNPKKEEAPKPKAKEIKTIENEVKSLANFFNGEVLDLDDN